MLVVREFKASVEIGCSPEAAFDFVADHRNVPRVLEGITRWQPLGAQATGVGARFAVEMRTLGIPMANTLVLDRWQRPRALAWVSDSGLIEQRGGWRFEPTAAGTRVTLRIAYTPPGAALGNLLAGRVDGIVRRRLERALAVMREILEAA